MNPNNNPNPFFLYEGPTIDLIKMVKDGDLKKVKMLINPTNLQITDEDGNSPLHWAVHEGYMDVVKYIISIGADIHATNNNLYTPFGGACYLGDLRMAE